MNSKEVALEKRNNRDRRKKIEAASLDLVESTLQFARSTINPDLILPTESWIDDGDFSEEFWEESEEDTSRTGGKVGAWGRDYLSEDRERLLVKTWREPCLFWREPYQSQVDKTESVAPENGKCLSNFLDLASASEFDLAPAVQDFASRWGVLGIWPSICADASTSGCKLIRWEPLSLWQETALRVQGTLLVFADLSAYSPKPAPETEWDKIVNRQDRQRWFKAWQIRHSEEAQLSLSKNVVAQQQLLVHAVNEWLHQIYQEPSFVWTTPSPIMSLKVNGSGIEWDYERLNSIYPDWVEMQWRNQDKHSLTYQAPPIDLTSAEMYEQFRFRPSNLFSVIALQLAATLTGRNGVKECDFCHEPYVPSRRNPISWANLCEKRECRADNDARRQREYAKRRKQNALER